jgi:Ca-activated chloride channel family protein
MAATRVSTSTLGVGSDYNEDLMEAISEAGDGNYYFVETAVQLADIFQTELNGLMATTARDVGLKVEPARTNVTVQVLNQLEPDASGRLKLANLVTGMPISILVRLKVPASPAERSRICHFNLDWDEPGSQSTARRSLTAALELPAVSFAAWSEMIVDPAVAEQVTLHVASVARKEAIAALDRGDQTTAQAFLGQAYDAMLCAPMTAEINFEMECVSGTLEHLKKGQSNSARKSAHYQQHNRKQGRSSQPPK